MTMEVVAMMAVAVTTAVASRGQYSDEGGRSSDEAV